MAQPTSREVHIDSALSNISVAYKNSKYIADMVFPALNVEKQSDFYYTFDKDFWFRNVVKRRGPGANYEEGGFEVSNTQYFCNNFGLQFRMPFETIENADAAIDLETTGAEWLADQFMLNREEALKAAIMDASAWGSDTTLSTTDQWSDYENSDPIGDIETGIQTIEQATGMAPNVALMGAQVWDKLRRHPDLLDIYKYTTTGNLNEAQVAQAIGVEKLAIGRAVKNSAAEGVSFSGAYIWDKNMILMFVASSPGLRIASAGYTFLWLQNGFTVTIEGVEDRFRRSNVLLGDNAFDQKVVASDAGYEIINAVA